MPLWIGAIYKSFNSIIQIQVLLYGPHFFSLYFTVTFHQSLIYSRRYHHGLCFGIFQEPTSLTFKEFLDSFRRDEHEEVENVFKDYRWDNQGQGDNVDNPKYSLYLDKVSAYIMQNTYL